MGLTEGYLALQRPTPLLQARCGEALLLPEWVHGDKGWVAAEVHGEDLPMLQVQAQDLRRRPFNTVAAAVYDSDCAFVQLKARSVPALVLVLGPGCDQTCPFGAPTAGRLAADALLEWSSQVGGPAPTHEQVQQLQQVEHVFAEQALEDLLRILGLPPGRADEARRYGGMVHGPDDRFWKLVAGRRRYFRHARYVSGQGSNYVGIWDQMSPAQPLATFESSNAGRRALSARFEELMKALPEDQWLAPRRTDTSADADR